MTDTVEIGQLRRACASYVKVLAARDAEIKQHVTANNILQKFNNERVAEIKQLQAKAAEETLLTEAKLADKDNEIAQLRQELVSWRARERIAVRELDKLQEMLRGYRLERAE